MALTSRRGASSRRRIVDAATGSVGDTIAPSTNAACHDMSGMTACAAQSDGAHRGEHQGHGAHHQRAHLSRKSLKLAKNADL